MYGVITHDLGVRVCRRCLSSRNAPRLSVILLLLLRIRYYNTTFASATITPAPPWNRLAGKNQTGRSANAGRRIKRTRPRLARAGKYTDGTPLSYEIIRLNNASSSGKVTLKFTNASSYSLRSSVCACVCCMCVLSVFPRLIILWQTRLVTVVGVFTEGATYRPHIGHVSPRRNVNFNFLRRVRTYTEHTYYKTI